jgi:hypothetical protein
MLYKIMERIEFYSASVNKPVVAKEYGDKDPPAPPYVVVKQEQDIGLAGTAFRIITHMRPGQQKALRQFNRTVIGQALDDFKATSESGSYNRLKSDPLSVGGIIITSNSDQTISLERLYFMGDRLY